MAKNYTKKEAVSIAISAARLYRDNFVGRRLLFLLTDKHKNVFSLEVGFDASNYQHLTGLLSTNKSWSHLDFYNFCIDARLKEEHIVPVFAMLTLKLTALYFSLWFLQKMKWKTYHLPRRIILNS